MGAALTYSGRHWGVVLMVAAASCGPATDSAGHSEDVSAAVRSATDAFITAQREREPEDAIRLLAPDFYMYADGFRLGYDSVSAQMRRTMPTLRRIEPTWEQVEVQALGPDHALVTTTFRDFIVDATGESFRLRGPTTLVWRRDETGWKMIYADADHYPDSLP